MAKAGTLAATAHPLNAETGAALLGQVFGAAGAINVGRVAAIFRMSRAQLAETAGLGASTLAKTSRQQGARAQARLAEMLEIINRIEGWAGGEAQAMAWYRSQPIPALDGRTAEALVKSGRAGAVRDYLDHLALGGYA